VTAEVRIQDVVNSESINIYRQLGEQGNTVMHCSTARATRSAGSARVDPEQVGELPDQLLLRPLPPTIKFRAGGRQPVELVRTISMRICCRGSDALPVEDDHRSSGGRAPRG